MHAPAADHDDAAIVARLRGAGCVFAEEEAALILGSATGAADVEAMVARRVAGLPLEHVLGWVEFCGRRYAVAPGVFVPRRRTELLVAAAVARGGRVVVDLCCGCGAVGAAVAAGLGTGAEVHAADVDAAAVECARRNLAGVGVGYVGDLDEPLPARLRGRVDVLVANVPYVPSAAIALLPPEARDFEPRVALDGGADGLDVVRRVAAVAPGWLTVGGHLLVETDESQAETAAAVFGAAGLGAEIVSSADSTTTVVVGRCTAPAGPATGTRPVRRGAGGSGAAAAS